MKHGIVIYTNKKDDQIIFTETDDLGQAHNDYKMLDVLCAKGEIKNVAIYGVVDKYE